MIFSWENHFGDSNSKKGDIMGVLSFIFHYSGLKSVIMAIFKD
jgi:hypothetical protein